VGLDSPIWLCGTVRWLHFQHYLDLIYVNDGLLCGYLDLIYVNGGLLCGYLDLIYISGGLLHGYLHFLSI
jgi:hypothetical protein